ncbi:hypothetical protein JCM3775_004386 [Rhodotorula graminis]|uniref:Uncharacterized protein n=1 Tax=Rhodotorula graminis (strain WP1) TaxID=578459 RepID=A0A194SBV5_RHOGW|nr:uncharacterized protein RHOBADRAFT_50457 [Rhodotorula graminis WP1]KPV77930.1 hypothetical protein RHOBADRAFT_50457 [Rhodotorula graminis WP1]
MASLVPTTLDEHTVPNILAQLDATLYPAPTSGLLARMAVLWTLTGLSIIVAVLYLYLHYQNTIDRRRSLWLVRLVDRPSGRFVVINPRPALTGVVIIYSIYALVYEGAFWYVYSTRCAQNLYIGVRNFNPVPLFIGGWILSWSGLQAFLVAVESERKFMSARTANTFFIVGGTLLVLSSVGIGIYTTIMTVRILDRYNELRAALVELERSLGSRVPALLDLIPLQLPAEAFVSAANGARRAGIVQGAAGPFLLLPIAISNIGGIALAIRMRRQIRESIKVLADGVATVAPSTTRARIDAREVRAMARQRPGERATVTTAHARKIMALQKAAKDLLATTSVIAFVSLCLFFVVAWIAWCSVTNKLSDTSNNWPYVESTALLSEWIYAIAITTSLFYLLYNAVRARRRIPDLEAASPGAVRPVLVGVGPGAGSMDLGEKSTSLPHEQEQVEVEMAESDPSASELPSFAREQGDSAAGLLPPATASDAGRRPLSPARSWASFASNREGSDSSPGGWRSSWLGRGAAPKLASPAASIMVTVETSQVCDDGSRTMCAPWDGRDVPSSR